MDMYKVVKTCKKLCGIRYIKCFDIININSKFYKIFFYSFFKIILCGPHPSNFGVFITTASTFFSGMEAVSGLGVNGVVEATTDAGFGDVVIVGVLIAFDDEEITSTEGLFPFL